MKHLPYRLICFITLLLLTACRGQQVRYEIGVSQCSQDSWRAKLRDELEMSTFFNEGVVLRTASANDDNVQQERQIDSLVRLGVDLLIVSPNQVDALTGAIERAERQGIPVILYDRKTASSRYTAFMGADNYLIGQMLGEYVAAQLSGRGNIVEIEGLEGSSPAIARHEGFRDAIARYPGLRVIGEGKGDWKEASGSQVMRQLLTDGLHEPIDCIFGANDRMAIGARKVIDPTFSSRVLCVGVDALPTEGGGIEQVRDGKLTASALYPTHGDELMTLALNILEGKTYQKETILQSSMVTRANANILLLQHEEIVRQGRYLGLMHQRVDTVLAELGIERLFLIFILVVTVVFCVLFLVAVHGYRAKHALSLRLAEEKTRLAHEKEIVERQRDELEEQRDLLIEARGAGEGDNEATGSDILDGNEPAFRVENEFMQRFQQCIDSRLADSEFSVEVLGQDMCLSRVQLYRKVKAMTGQSPVEIIRTTRLQKASQLLANTSLTVSEVAYRVGFTSPSYFTKCYKDYYGKAPTDR